MSQFERNMKYLHDNKIVYRRNPINDKPTKAYTWGMFFEEGTFECYELFRSKAKITTYKSLKWHLLVLSYLNPQLTEKKFKKIAIFIADKENGFVAFNIKRKTLKKIIHEVNTSDLEEPPKNKSRKIIFKDGCNLTPQEKLQIAGALMGRAKKIDEYDIYDAMIQVHERKKKITISAIAKQLNTSTRTIYRTMNEPLKKEKELLNLQLKNEKI